MTLARRFRVADTAYVKVGESVLSGGTVRVTLGVTSFDSVDVMVGIVAERSRDIDAVTERVNV